MTRAPAAVLAGTGPFGAALARRLALSGIAVTIGSREPARARAAAAQLDAPGLDLAGASNRTAAARAGAVFLAAPFAGQAALLETLGAELDGKLVICCAVIWPPGSRPETSAAEEAARALRSAGAGRARVAAAFQTVAARVLAHDGTPGADDPDVLVFADRPEDREAAAEVCGLTGLRTVPAGPLRGARAAEAFVGALMHLNRIGARHAGIRLTGLRS